MIAGIGYIGQIMLFNFIKKTHQSNIEWENSNCPLNVEEGVFPSFSLWRKCHLSRIGGSLFRRCFFDTLRAHDVRPHFLRK